MPLPLPASSRFLPIADELRAALHPAQLALFEWTDYFFQWPDADALLIDKRRVEPLAPGVFRVRWENALGLCQLQPLCGGKPLEAPLWVEVLSPKFPTPQKHVAFLSALLSGLFALSPHLIWHDAGATARGAQSLPRAPSALGALDWLRRNGLALEQTLAAIARHPAREWRGQSFDARAHQVTALDARALATLASDGARWQRSTGRNLSLPLSSPLPSHSRIVGDWVPNSVPQSRRHQSFDVADNRGALAFVGEVGGALRAAKASAGWNLLDADQREGLAALERMLGGWGAGWRGEVGALREGWQPRVAPYRALWELKQSWGENGAPLWEGAQRFAAVRDVASLWEFAVFFLLIAQIEAARGETATLRADWDAARGLLAPARARWGEDELVFNGPAPSYSTPLRPDYLWSKSGRAVAAFDAKFRVEVPGGGGRGADLHKMHAYRDALGVRAAVALHPGDVTTWFDRERGPLGGVPLRAILEGVVAGVGLWGIGAG